jgi:hypothetical protein
MNGCTSGEPDQELSAGKQQRRLGVEDQESMQWLA